MYVLIRCDLIYWANCCFGYDLPPLQVCVKLMTCRNKALTQLLRAPIFYVYVVILLSLNGLACLGMGKNWWNCCKTYSFSQQLSRIASYSVRLFVLFFLSVLEIIFVRPSHIYSTYFIIFLLCIPGEKP